MLTEIRLAQRGSYARRVEQSTVAREREEPRGIAGGDGESREERHARGFSKCMLEMLAL